MLAEPDACVVALGDDVGQPVLDVDLDLDVGKLRQEVFQPRPEDGVGGVFARRDADRAGRLVPELRQRFDLGLDFLEARADRDEQTFAGLGRRNAARAAGQKPKPHAGFQPADGVAERRLRDAELCGGAGKTPLPGDGEESRQIGEVGARHS